MDDRPRPALERLQELAKDAKRLQVEAEEQGDLRAALAALAQVVRVVEVCARLSGEEAAAQEREVHEVASHLPQTDLWEMALLALSTSAKLPPSWKSGYRLLWVPDGAALPPDCIDALSERPMENILSRQQSAQVLVPSAT
jgi:hypothetical protein